MFKLQLVKRAAEKRRKQVLPQRVYKEALEELLAGIKSELAQGRNVQILGFGTFYTRMQRGGTGINFKTGKTVEYKARRVPAFRPGEVLKRAVRKKK